MNVAVVVPTCRPEKMSAWYGAWSSELASVNAELYVVEDSVCKSRLAFPAEHFAQTDIDADLGSRRGLISTHTDGIRCYGFLRALRDGADIIVTLDDDVVPMAFCLQQHIGRLSNPIVEPAWHQTAPFRTRGLPYRNTTRDKHISISHGLWTGVPDLDAATQLASDGYKFASSHDYSKHCAAVPIGQYFPMSAMNLAFTREIAPAMYFPPMGAGQPYDRFGDIWCGVIAKRVCDHLRLGVWSGGPFVHHERASDPLVNLQKEAPGIGLNEEFWGIIDGIDLGATRSPAEAVLSIVTALTSLEQPYMQLLGQRLYWWLDAINEVLP